MCCGAVVRGSREWWRWFWSLWRWSFDRPVVVVRAAILVVIITTIVVALCVVFVPVVTLLEGFAALTAFVFSAHQLFGERVSVGVDWFFGDR